MSWYDVGNPPINSTRTDVVSNPDTNTFIAQLDSTQLGTKDFRASEQRNVRVTAALGASTNGTWRIERFDGSTTAEAFPFLTPSAQSGQFVLNLTVGKDNAIRARVASSATANYAAVFQAEYIT